MERYSRNHTAITPDEQTKLSEGHVLIAGCGGLGGYIIELLTRIGVGHLTVVDGDVFCESNLNRQLLSTTETLGKSKAEAAVERMASVNPLVSGTAVCKYLTEENADSLLAGQDVAVDALDNGESRALLLAAARRANIPLVHGAIAGWYGRVSVIYPGDATSALMQTAGRGLEQQTGNLSFTASSVASIQAAETVKCLLSKGQVCRNRTIELDLLSGNFEEITFV